MKAVALVGPGRLEVREAPDPEPGPGEAVSAAFAELVADRDRQHKVLVRPAS